MKPILLRKTWTEIANYLDDTPQVIRIVETINRLKPRPWTFRFSFSRAGHTDLLIDAQPPLSAEEMRFILDGFLEEVFLADRVVVHGEQRDYSVEIGAVLADPPAHNRLMLTPGGGAQGLRGLELVGFARDTRLPPPLHSTAAVAEALMQRTWLGAHRLEAHPLLALRWSLYGRITAFGPLSRLTTLLGANETFTRDLVLFDQSGNHLGSALAGTSPRLSTSSVWTDFGPIEATHFPAGGRYRPTAPAPHWFVEIRDGALMADYWSARRPTRSMRDTLQAVETALAALERQPVYRSYLRGLRRSEKRRAAFALTRRQQRTATAQWVAYNGQPLQAAPSCENEVVVLLSKLEILGGVPFHHFELVEYTAKKGIDALANFQISPEEVPTVLGAVEVEFYFESFLLHRHPIEQVNLVVCWDFKVDNTGDERLTSRRPWLYAFRDGDYGFPVLVLSRIPGIVQREAVPWAAL